MWLDGLLWPAGIHPLHAHGQKLSLAHGLVGLATSLLLSLPHFSDVIYFSITLGQKLLNVAMDVIQGKGLDFCRSCLLLWHFDKLLDRTGWELAALFALPTALLQQPPTGEKGSGWVTEQEEIFMLIKPCPCVF